VHRIEEEPEGLREEVSAVHAALPGSGSVGLPALARKVDLRPAVVQGAVYRMMVDGVVEAVPRGSLVDVRLRTTSLDDDSRRTIAARLKNRDNMAYAQIRDVESYAALRTCRREHLLRHFGDQEEVAPCAGCDVCLGEIEEPAGSRVPLGTPLVSAFAHLAPEDDGSGVDPELFERLRSWRSEQARRQQVPAYVVLHNSHLEEISTHKPRTMHELGAMKGIGLRRAARYGDELLALIHGEEVAAHDDGASAPETTETNGFRTHLESAERLLREGRGADAVPELGRAIELGGEEARREVDQLLSKARVG
jgi:ATP-dependent DNA helicase RecQ